MRFSFSNTAATERGHPHTISLKLRDTNQLFNSMDPSPFIEKDLDDDAEEFIVSWAQEFPPNAPIKLRLFLSKMLLGHEAGTWAAVVRESLTIAGWVAMWRPMQIYLYDWWPLLQLRRVFAKLSHMPVELVQKGKVE
jgi:hypothetical protein